MTFISYAQNFEDVMLWRALKDVDKGFYIDVGANDPIIDSVTKAFYDCGWRGINIEPIELYYQALVQDRPRDINLLCAVGRTSGKIDIFNCEVRGWATGDKNNAERLIKEGHQGEYHRVSIKTLSEVCREFVTGEIHFLKIDVEGLEKDVVLGADLDKFRPWIIVLEATKPNSTEDAYGEWEHDIIEANYNFAYADGVNRFYVSQEHSELIVSFQYPPNAFDDFQVYAEIRAQKAELKAQQANLRAQEAESHAEQAHAIAQEAELRSEQAHAIAQEAESRAEQAKAKAQEAELQAEQAKLREHQAESKAEEAEGRANEAELKAQEATSRAMQSEATLAMIYNSRIWRITAPWRWAGNIARWIKRCVIAWLTFAPGSRPRRILRYLLVSAKNKLANHPIIKGYILKWLTLFPQLKNRLHIIGGNPSIFGSNNYSALTNRSVNVGHLSPRARTIYFDLKSAIDDLQMKERNE